MTAAEHPAVQNVRMHDSVSQQARVNHNGGNIYLWGCFASSGVSNLHMISHTLTHGVIPLNLKA